MQACCGSCREGVYIASIQAKGIEGIQKRLNHLSIECLCDITHQGLEFIRVVNRCYVTGEGLNVLGVARNE